MDQRLNILAAVLDRVSEVERQQLLNVLVQYPEYTEPILDIVEQKAKATTAKEMKAIAQQEKELVQSILSSHEKGKSVE